jgi:hypothetical protein
MLSLACTFSSRGEPEKKIRRLPGLSFIGERLVTISYDAALGSASHSSLRDLEI